MSKMLKLKNNPTLIYPSYTDLDPTSTRSYYSNQWLAINNQQSNLNNMDRINEICLICHNQWKQEIRMLNWLTFKTGRCHVTEMTTVINVTYSFLCNSHHSVNMGHWNRYLHDSECVSWKTTIIKSTRCLLYVQLEKKLWLSCRFSNIPLYSNWYVSMLMAWQPHTHRYRWAVIIT